MALVRNLLLELVRQIDPKTEDDTPFTTANIGVVDGAIFPKELHLDFYNEARFALYEVLRSQHTLPELIKMLGSSVIRKPGFEFSGGIAQRPAHYIQVISIHDATGKAIYVASDDKQQDVQEGRNPYYKESATNRFVFQLSGLSAGSVAPSGAFILDVSLLDTMPLGAGGEEIEENAGTAPYFYSLSGNQYIPDGSNYIIVYIGVKKYELSDVTNATTIESYDIELHKWIKEYAVRISKQEGMVDALAFARGITRDAK